jgi:MFS family permease
VATRGRGPHGQDLTYRGWRMTAAASPVALSPAALGAARRHSRNTLIAGVALGSTGHIAAVTVATIVAQDLLGSQVLAGAPGATVVLGAALGAVLLSALMARRGRRAGLVTGYSVGVIGALIATAAVITRSFPLLLFGTVLIGFGNASNQLSRYAASDMVPPERRASAIGLVVWAATIGSVVGPWLVPIASGFAASVGLPPLAGPYLVPVVFVGLAALLSFLMLRPDPYDLADDSTRADPEAEPAVILPIREILRRPAVAAAIVALVVGQFVMVLIMTMTPLHMTEHGHDLAAVGLVLSGHTMGMFAFSPLSGWLSDRFGRVPTIFLGTATLAVACVMAAAAPPDGGFMLLLAMFLLGLGWSFGFVAGSAMLSENLEIHERTRVQGVADALIWSSAAAASLGSGLIMAVVGYTALGILGAGAVIMATVVLWAHHRAAADEAGLAATVEVAAEAPHP